jgi:hypothetical protein
MEVRIFNDFTSYPIKGGRRYHMTTEDGDADVTNLMYGGGLVVNYSHFRTSGFNNQERIGEMNYLMICGILAYRQVIETDTSLVADIPGSF